MSRRAIIPALILGTAVSQAAAERVCFWQEAKRFAHRRKANKKAASKS
jgi:hypothetical protein